MVDFLTGNGSPKRTSNVGKLLVNHGTYFSIAAEVGASRTLYRITLNRPVNGGRHLVAIPDIHKLPRREQLDMRQVLEDTRACRVVASAAEESAVVLPLRSRFDVKRCPGRLPEPSYALQRALGRVDFDDASLAAGIMEVIERRRVCTALLESTLCRLSTEDSRHAATMAATRADERLAQTQGNDEESWAVVRGLVSDLRVIIRGDRDKGAKTHRAGSDARGGPGAPCIDDRAYAHAHPEGSSRQGGNVNGP